MHKLTRIFVAVDEIGRQLGPVLRWAIEDCRRLSDRVPPKTMAEPDRPYAGQFGPDRRARRRPHRSARAGSADAACRDRAEPGLVG